MTMTTQRRHALQPWLGCGVAAGLVYVAADVVAALLYPGYSYADQAVSELFAVGAPTAPLVVALFSLSSLLLLGFAYGVHRVSGRRRLLRVMAWLFAIMAINALLLWNLFPMHMRGAERGATDTMHILLSLNPAFLVTLVLGAIAFRGGFRIASLCTLAILILSAAPAYAYVPAIDANLPTPGLGLAERVAQYAYQLWQAGLALLLMRTRN